jgi:hypothetical protein
MCDTLPLQEGHNFWDQTTNQSIRLHNESKRICGPKVLIVGAMKCGTNTLGHLLAKHPRVKVNSCHAPKYWPLQVQGNHTNHNTTNTTNATTIIHNLNNHTEKKLSGCAEPDFQGRFNDIWEGK